MEVLKMNKEEMNAKFAALETVSAQKEYDEKYGDAE